MKTWALITSALACGALLASAVSAASVSATLYTTSSTPQGVQPGTDTSSLSFNGGTGSVGWAGQINWHSATSADWTSGLNPKLQSILGPDGTFSTFCIEGTQDVQFGSNETWSLGVVPLSSAANPGPGMGATKAADITELFDRSYVSAITSNETAAAFQLAVWEIVYDGSVGSTVTSTVFSNGSFTASNDSAAIDDAVAMLKGITGSGFANTYTVYALSDGTIQDQIFAVPNSVPVPAALPSGLALLVGLAAYRKIRAKVRA